MDRADAQRFAERWVAAWNARDLEAVLAWFEDDVIFTSPRALAVAGVPTVRGKAALRAYWMRALAAIRSLIFRLDRIAFDPSTLELAILYDRDADGRVDRAAEVLRFGSSGRVASAEVFHGLLPL